MIGVDFDYLTLDPVTATSSGGTLYLPFLFGVTANGNAVIIEATLSYLGVGLPPTSPSLGTLIRNGYAFLFSGEWWIVIFPALALVILSLSVNLLGDWLRDAINPKLR